VLARSIVVNSYRSSFLYFFFSVGAIFDFFFIIIIIYSNPNNTPRRLRRFLSVITQTHTHTHTHYTIGPAPDARLYSLCYYYYYAGIYTLPGARVSFCFFGIVEIRLLATTIIIIIYVAPISVSLSHAAHITSISRRVSCIISYYVDSSSDRSDIIIRL
jgi:hypothetical protein